MQAGARTQMQAQAVGRTRALGRTRLRRSWEWKGLVLLFVVSVVTWLAGVVRRRREKLQRIRANASSIAHVVSTSVDALSCLVTSPCLVGLVEDGCAASNASSCFSRSAFWDTAESATAAGRGRAERRTSPLPSGSGTHSSDMSARNALGTWPLGAAYRASWAPPWQLLAS